MTAEEYIKSKRREDYPGGHLCYTVTEEDALKAIEMARNEKNITIETEYVRVPFNIELAKRITNGTKLGRIVTRDGLNARIVCFDARGNYPIVALLDLYHYTETISTVTPDGRVDALNAHEDPLDLFIEIPKCQDSNE